MWACQHGLQREDNDGQKLDMNRPQREDDDGQKLDVNGLQSGSGNGINTRVSS